MGVRAFQNAPPAHFETPAPSFIEKSLQIVYLAVKRGGLVQNGPQVLFEPALLFLLLNRQFPGII
jgi:hypothetical protein